MALPLQAAVKSTKTISHEGHEELEGLLAARDGMCGAKP
jgi:hypothetical protein